MKETIGNMLESCMDAYPRLNVLRKDIIAAFEIMKACFLGGGKLLVCGNGGSAADSDHMVAELMKGFKKKRPVDPAELPLFLQQPRFAQSIQRAMPAISLCAHTALITAYANDVAPEMAFAQQVYGYMAQKDVLIGMSTSGNSQNVINALLLARALGGKTIGFTGEGGGVMKSICHVALCVPSTDTPRIQEMHLPLYHLLCEMLEEELF